MLCGDISNDYLYYHRNAVPKILEEKNAQILIIIVLRNPIDRAYSHYLNHVRDGWEKESFEDALNAEEERRAANWSWGWNYIASGLYAEQVKAYMDNFERVLLCNLIIPFCSQGARRGSVFTGGDRAGSWRCVAAHAGLSGGPALACGREGRCGDAGWCTGWC